MPLLAGIIVHRDVTITESHNTSPRFDIYYDTEYERQDLEKLYWTFIKHRF